MPRFRPSCMVETLGTTFFFHQCMANDDPGRRTWGSFRRNSLMLMDIYWLGCNLQGGSCILSFSEIPDGEHQENSSLQYSAGKYGQHPISNAITGLLLPLVHWQQLTCPRNYSQQIHMLKFQIVYFFTSKMRCIPIIMTISHKSCTHTIFCLYKYLFTCARAGVWVECECVSVWWR